RETTLKTGRQFKFRTAPVDPYDAFRGRYVAIGIENNAAIDYGAPEFKPGQKEFAGSRELKPGQRVYAHITVDAKGFASFSKVTANRPEGNAYIQTTVNFVMNEPAGSKVYFRLPFDRYYMEEKAAPAAESAYRRYSMNPERSNAYITVRVKEGFAVLEELYIDGKPIRDFVRESGRSGG
ncbi:MAG: GDYXXLXY domain-containing protein, partial [Bacillota bacterium]